MRTYSKRSKRVCIVVLSVLICWAGMSGCTAEHKRTVQERQRKERAQKAYHSARSAIMREPILTIDIIWLLQELQKAAPDETLEAFVNQKAAGIKKHHSLLLIDPSAPRSELPETLPSGIARYTTYLRSPFGKPKERAIRYITEFVSTEESGYDLTHQFAVLVWAEQTGLELPPKLGGRKEYLWNKIYQEQMVDDSFFDLYAERAALLLRFGKPKPEDVAIWIDAIVEFQLPDGNWKLASTIRKHGSQTAVLTPPARHTTALALLALQVYIAEY